MMKKVYLAFLSLAVVVSMIVGLVIHTGDRNWFKFGFNFISSDDEKNKVEKALDDVGNQVKITIDCECSDVTIKKGDKFHVKYNDYKNLVTNVSAGEDYIEIKQTSKHSINLKEYDSDIVLTVPKDVEITELNIDNNLGCITLDNLNIVTGQIDADLGDVDLKKVVFKDMDITANLGDIEVDSGNNLDDYSISASISLGSCNINGMKGSSDYEKVGKEGTLTIDADLGDIDVEW